jgi:hypothetical protein
MRRAAPTRSGARPLPSAGAGPLCLAALLCACASDQKVVRQEGRDVFYQVPTDQVDILWVTDNSQSMADEQAGIAARFEDFVSALELSAVDFQIGVITTDMEDTAQKGKLQAPEGEPLYLSAATPDYVARFADRIQVGIGGSDKEKGIDAAFQALSEPLVSGYNGGFIRPEATLSIVYLSDENDCTDRGALAAYDEGTACYEHAAELTSIKELIADYKSIKDDGSRVLVSSIVGPEIDESCEGAVPGFRYAGMAEAFGGVQGSICDADFSAVMTELGLQVSGVLTSFQLEYPAVEESILVWVDDAPVEPDPVNGWSYDAEYYIVYFHGTGVPARGAQIVIEYDIGAPGE